MTKYAKRDQNGKIIKRFDRDVYARKFEAANRRHADVKQPDDLVFYPSAAMKLSRQGTDKGAIKRDMEDRKVIGDDGKVYHARAVKDGLSRMYDKGSITLDHLNAAREFQKHFMIAGYDRIKTTSLTGISGGGMTIEDQMARTMTARRYCHEVKDMLGGSESPMWKAMFWLVGHGYGLRRFAKEEGYNGDYWNGILKASLFLLGIEYRKAQRNRKR